LNPPIVSSNIQQKFVKLFQEISVFYAGDRQIQDKDTFQLTAARTAAFELAKEATSPHFDRFLAYVLGNSEITADYPLQAVRMLCLMAKALQGETLSADVLQDLLTAALLADTGFRPGWLGHHGSHFDITTYQLRTLGLPWFTQGLERLIAGHHTPESDPSPCQILSLLGEYLGMVYGTGIENVTQTLMSPAKTIEKLMSEHHHDADGIRVLMKTLSAFPLGSWVLLNSGQTALVIGSNPRNPLRPRVGLYRATSKTTAAWEECDLEKKPTIHIAAELAPTEAQRALLNFPELLVPGWIPPADTPESRRTPPAPETVNTSDTSAPVHSVLPPNLRNADDYRRFILHQNKTVTPFSSVSSSGKTDIPEGSSEAPAWKTVELRGEPSTGKRQLLKFYREELIKLRTTWEQQVRAAEQVSASLKSPLIDSYRRENELMSTMIERLEAIGADVAEPPAALEERAPEETPSKDEPVVAAVPMVPEPAVKLSDQPRTGLDQIQKRLASFQDQAEKDQGTLRRLKDRFGETLRHLESREYKTLPSLIAFVKQWQGQLQPMGRSLEQAEKETLILTEEWGSLHDTVKALVKGPKKNLSQSWQDQIKPRMEQLLSAAEKALAAHHHHLKSHEDMIERFCSEARQLAN
jgi:hypothetical protein